MRHGVVRRKDNCDHMTLNARNLSKNFITFSKKLVICRGNQVASSFLSTPLDLQMILEALMKRKRSLPGGKQKICG